MSETQSPRPDQTVRSFSAFLGVLEDGAFHADLTRHLQEAVAEMQNAVLDRGGKPRAKLRLDLNLKLEAGIVEVTGDFKVTLPKAERGRTVFWATPENNLSRSNPRQADMFRDVSGPAETRTIA
jgi:hypothetical protein